MSGISRKEQWALIGLVGVILLGLGVRQWRQSGSEAALLADPQNGAWHQMAELEAQPGGTAAWAAGAVEPAGSTAVQSAGAATPAAAAVTIAISSTTLGVGVAPQGEVVPAVAVAAGGLIDINAAGAAELEELPGIGPAKAAAILNTRARLGGFRSIEQLNDVPGIGDKTLARLRPLVSVGGTGPVAPVAAAVVPAPVGSAAAGAALMTAPIAAPVVAPVLAPAVAPASPPVAPLSINLNTAGAAELEKIKGIGPVLAGRILAHRARYGPFTSLEQLEAVPGIGPRTLEKLRPFLTLTGR